MKITEVKNNLVKVTYETSSENLVLSGFVVIKDSSQSFIAQIIHLEANAKGNFAIVQLLFTFDEQGIITEYNGSVPDINSVMDIVHSQEILELLPVQNPIYIGEVAQQKTDLNLDISLFEQKLLVCSEKKDETDFFINNLIKQLSDKNKKVLVIDLSCHFKGNKVIAASDFKLPLNYETINFIYNKLDDASAETKASVQEIFLEVQDYVKTLPEKFIPFETFKNVVDAQYQETEMVELVLLKNKLLKYYESGIFAQNKEEFELLENSLNKKEPTVFDISKVDEQIQREMISYVYSVIKESSQEIYVICNLGNYNSDKKLLKQIFTTEKAYSTIICPYSYKYLKELKQLSKNLILFAPIQQQNDFASYNVFLSKLNTSEFIIYGQSTHYLPFIVKLQKISNEIFQEPVVESEKDASEILITPSATTQPEENLLDEEIKRDVDEIYTAPKTEQMFEEIPLNTENTSDELTEDDLDFIDKMNILEDETKTVENREEIPNVNFETELAEEYLQVIENQPAFENFNIQEKEKIEEDADAEGTKTFQNILREKDDESDIQESPEFDILPVKIASNPTVPIYSAEVEVKAQSDKLEQGDSVIHPKYGKGVVEKLITYGNKTLCSINFENVGRRLLDPNLVELKKA